MPCIPLLTKPIQDNRLQKLAPSLWACYNSEKAAELKRGPCTEGTRTNVLVPMREWATSLNSGGVYWMNGMAGTGKTTIAYSLCQQLDTPENRLLCASFFCSRSLPECRSVGRIIPSIAYQIAQCSRPFRYALSKATEENPDAHTRSAHLQFDSLILQPFSDARVREAFPTNMVVVIDALDECEDVKSTQQILEVLLTKSKGLPIKFMVSSRPEASIRYQMEKNGTWVDSRVVLHQLDSGEVQTDITTYLKTELTPISPSELDIKKLADRAGVLFIYAATVIRYVGYDDFGRNPQARLNAVLGMSEKQGTAQTKEIDQLYGAILGAAIGDERLEPTERDDMKLVLHTVICAKASLTVDALNGLLKFDDVGRVHAALRPLWSVLHVMSPEMTVTTLHASFPDYLTDPRRSGNSKWHCDATTHHGILAQKSFENIRDTIPQFNICRLDSSYLYDSQVEDLDTRVDSYIPLELRYACQYWSAHLDASDSELVSLLEQLLTKQLLLWMEVMNLTKNIATTPENLMSAKKWATKHGATDELIALIQDAWRFAQTVVSSPVSQSTPHIYVSMVPFLSSYSPIRKLYAHRMQRMIGVEGTALDRREPLLARWDFGLSLCVGHSPDGTLFAIKQEILEHQISIIDTASGRKVRSLFHKDVDRISCLTFSPDGTRVACGTYHDDIWVWDSHDATRVWHIGSEQPFVKSDKHQNSIRAITFSHDGAHIVSGYKNGIIRVWDAYSGQMALPLLVGHFDDVLTIAVAFDNTRIVSGSSDNTVRVWEMQSGRPVFDPIRGHTGIVHTVAFTPNNSFIVSCCYGMVCVRDSHTGQSLLSPFLHKCSIYSMTISPDSTCIAAGLSGDTIRIWDVTSGKAISELSTGIKKAASMLTYSSDSTRIISYSDGNFGGKGLLCLFDAQNTSAPLNANSSFGHTEPIITIDISPNGEHIISGSADETICVWDPITGQLVLGPLTGHNHQVNIVRYAPAGSRFLSCSYDKTLRQWDAQTGDSLVVNNPIVDESYFVLATYSPDGSHIATISEAAIVCLWSSKTGEQVLGPMKGERTGISIQFSTDGATLLTGWNDGAVQIWDMQSGQLVSIIPSQNEIFRVVSAFSPDGLRNVVAESYPTHSMHQRITQTGEHIPWSFKGDPKSISNIQFSHDGSRIVSGSYDRTVHIWDAQTGDSVFGPLKGHINEVTSVAYSPDGTYIASASNDKAIRIWDVSMQPDSSPLIEWELKEDGWVVDKQSRRLIWVQVGLRSSLMSPINTALMSRDGYVRLSFDGALIGEGWDNCWLDN
ncbi:putative vegetative incompatibility protein HET-E-1 [Rhizoctonia solani 123E]|uniref:Putative vegetative incompatibility protein HET-E-1 n=1 Tax=Rhizoctonia solani 123E TaxID=1423351 RepID=A0A074RLG7_9AGAM|nr:putative vegetative incompatibility protein HET-E-1 [Rhizoctonia solani 123E]